MSLFFAFPFPVFVGLPNDLVFAGTHSNGNVNPDTEGDGESIEAMDRTTDTEKAQRGKGSYGGANVVHKRPYEKAAASVLKSPLGLFLLHILPHLIA